MMLQEFALLGRMVFLDPMNVYHFLERDQTAKTAKMLNNLTVSLKTKAKPHKEKR